MKPQHDETWNVATLFVPPDQLDMTSAILSTCGSLGCVEEGGRLKAYFRGSDESRQPASLAVPNPSHRSGKQSVDFLLHTLQKHLHPSATIEDIVTIGFNPLVREK